MWAETQKLQNFRRTVDEHLSKSPQSQIAVAIPTEETGDLAVSFEEQNPENKEPTERRLLVQPTSYFCDGKNRLTNK